MWKYLSFLLLCALGVDEVACLHCIHCMERSSDYTCKFVMPWESCTPTSTHCFAKISRFVTSTWLIKGCTEYRSCPEIEESGGFCCSGDLCNADTRESQIESELFPAVGESSGSGADELRFPESENVSASPEPWVLLDAENQTSGVVVTKYGESDIEETSTLRSREDVLKDLLSSEPWILQGETIGEEVGTNPIYNVSDLEQTHNISTVEQTLGSVDGEAKLPIHGIVEQAENVSMTHISEIEKMQIYLKLGVEQGFGNETFERMNIEVGDVAGALYEIGIPERIANATASYDYLGDVQVNIPASDSSSLQHTSSTANKDEYTPTLMHEPTSRQPSTHDAQEPMSWQPSTHDAQEPMSRQLSTHDAQEPMSWQPSTHDAQEPMSRQPSTHDAQEPMSRQPSTHDAQEPMSRQPSAHDAKEPMSRQPSAHDAQEPMSRQPSAHDAKEPMSRQPSTHDAQEPMSRQPSAQEPMSRQPSTHDAQEPMSRQPSTDDAQEPISRQPSTHDAQEPTSRQPSTHDTHDAQEPTSRQPSTHDAQEPTSQQPSTHDTHDAQEPTSWQPSAHDAHEPMTHAASLELQSNPLSQTELLDKWWLQRLLRIENDSLMKESADDSFVTSFDFPTNVTADNELSGSPSSSIESQTVSEGQPQESSNRQVLQNLTTARLSKPTETHLSTVRSPSELQQSSRGGGLVLGGAGKVVIPTVQPDDLDGGRGTANTLFVSLSLFLLCFLQLLC